jgi:hypothetical protein
MEGNNDNETWQPLSLATRRLLAKIDEEKQERPDNEGARSNEDNKDSVEHARYVEQRLRDIERFERMVEGYYRPRRKRKF